MESIEAALIETGREVILQRRDDLLGEYAPVGLVVRNTPCYDDWENDMAAASGALGVCVLAAGGTLVEGAACVAGYGVAVLAIDAAYENCLENTYE